MPTLIVQTGKHKGKKVALPDKEVIIGRDENCFIRLGSTDVSRRHCALVPTPKGLLVCDLGSQNGTIVNSVAIESETLLHPGDIIQVGSIQFQLEGAKPARPAGLDDDIAGWLSDSATEIPVASSDTTIISPSQVAPPAKPRPAGSKQSFASVAEEAQDIIRRHRESHPD